MPKDLPAKKRLVEIAFSLCVGVVLLLILGSAGFA